MSMFKIDNKNDEVLSFGSSFVQSLRTEHVWYKHQHPCIICSSYV